jgi:hypothetical protein
MHSEPRRIRSSWHILKSSWGVLVTPVHLKTGLWVEKYAPKGFLDLLSDEVINREVVRWLKSWDACVFGPGSSKGMSRPAAGGNDPVASGRLGNCRGALRPEHKVLLLCGPPGIIPCRVLDPSTNFWGCTVANPQRKVALPILEISMSALRI